MPYNFIESTSLQKQFEKEPVIRAMIFGYGIILNSDFKQGQFLSIKMQGSDFIMGLL